MFYAERGNKVCKIQEEEISKYLDNGYDILSEKGELIHKAMPNDIAALQTLVMHQQEEIKALKEALALANAPKETKAAKAKVEDVIESVEDTPVETPTKTRKKQQ